MNTLILSYFIFSLFANSSFGSNFRNHTSLETSKLSGQSSYKFSRGVFQQILPTKNISALLDNLFKGYDPKIRPGSGGSPTIVEIDVEVRSMGQISEMDMSFSMDCYFRQSWVDERLSFSETEEAFTLSLAVLERLWKPDTFIYNGKHSYPHLITTPNKFVRLHHSGKVLYSSRLTIQASCRMNLEDFPMDTQRCPLKLGSFGYTTQDVLYRWNDDRQLVIAQDMKLSQFELLAAPFDYENTTRQTEEHSTLLANFYLQRHMGNFLIQVYGPCMLLVVLSWVSFWLNREATADRISLGVTTVLTMTFLGLEARTDLPKVAYSTALDLFVWLSYGFIFATIIEFAFVHYFTKYGSGEIDFSDSEIEEQEEETHMISERNMETSLQLQLDYAAKIQLYQQESRCQICIPSTSYFCTQEFENGTSLHDVDLSSSSLSGCIENNLNVSSTNSYSAFRDGNQILNTPLDHLNMMEEREEMLPTGSCYAIQRLERYGESNRVCSFCHGRIRSESRELNVKRNNSWKSTKKKSNIRESMFCCKQNCNIGRSRRRVKMARAEESMGRIPKEEKLMNSVSRIDEISRILFPVCFLSINLIYWYAYLAHSQRLKNLTPPIYAPPPY